MPAPEGIGPVLAVIGPDGDVRACAMPLWFTDTVKEDLSDTMSGAGLFTATSTPVPAGEVHLMYAASIRSRSRAGCTGSISIDDGTVQVWLAREANLALNFPAMWNGLIVMAEGDYMTLTLSACQDGDSIEAGIWGHKTEI